MEFNHIDLCWNLVPVCACITKGETFLSYTSFMTSFVYTSNSIDLTLFCRIAVFQYLSIICQCGALASTYTICCVVKCPIFKSLALLIGRLFHMLSCRILPIINTKHSMSEWPNDWILRLPETTEQSVDTACSCDCPWLNPWFFPVALIWRGFVIIMQGSGLGLMVGWWSRLLRVVGVLAMADVGQNITQCIESVWEIHYCAWVLWMLP